MGSIIANQVATIDATALIDPAVRVGSGVVIGRGAILQGECVVGNDVSIGPGCVLDAGQGTLLVEAGCRLSASVTVAMPVTIARGARIRAGTIVTRDVPPHAIVSGNPAQIIGYTTSTGADTNALTGEGPPPTTGRQPTSVAGVTFHRLPKILDLRGNLTVGEFGRSIPFLPKRYFMVFGVPNSEIRGEHAHRICHQFLICAHGSCSVMADNGNTREEFILDDPSLGLHLPPLTWGVQYKYSPDAVLLVLASEFYDANEYIRDYHEFIELTRAHQVDTDAVTHQEFAADAAGVGATS